MKNSLSQEKVPQNERNAMFAHTLRYDEVSSGLQYYGPHALTTTSVTVSLQSTERRRLVYQTTVNTLY